AMKQAVPVAESQLKSNFVFNGSGFKTTGAERVTARCNTGTSHPPRSKAAVVIRLRAVLIEGSPQSKTKPASITKGIQARAICAGFFGPVLLLVSVSEDATAASVPISSVSSAGSSLNRQTLRGCQNRRKTTVEARDTKPPAISTRLLSMKFDHTN